MTKRSSETVTVLMPVLDDWTSCRALLADLDEVFADREERVRVLVVDDGSIEPHTGPFGGLALSTIEGVDILRLTRNLGHQRAIAIGMTHLAAAPPDWVVVMDADGEDTPKDIPRLLDRAQDSRVGEIVFASRARRAEGPVFRFFYILFKFIHRLLVGHGVRVGNFSVVPRRRLESLVTVSELWSHYAAAAFVSRQPHATVPCVRARRIDGKSRMNFVGLVTHGLGAISVFSDVVGVRLLLAAGLLGFASILAMLTVGAIRLFTDFVIPVWSGITLGVFLVATLQTVLFAFSLTFTILNRRSAGGFLPVRDCHWFIAEKITAFPAESGAS